ncbi:hypothetical protein Aduo_016460 [Ancylostoma duodenale]
MYLLYILLCFQMVLPFQFLRKKTNYDEKTARKLLNMAAGAYGDQQPACLKRTFPHHDAFVVLTTAKEDCDAFGNKCESYIAASNVKKELIFVFRGSKTKGQILLQGFQYLKRFENFFNMGGVNGYFKNGHNVLWPLVEQALMNPKYANYKATFTGHSLGGALAALAAVRTAKQGYRRGNQITVYTFGEPRVGDKTFATNFDALIRNSYRVVFRRDIVPHISACAKVQKWSDSWSSRPCDANAKNMPYHHSTEIWLA